MRARRTRVSQHFLANNVRSWQQNIFVAEAVGGEQNVFAVFVAAAAGGVELAQKLGVAAAKVVKPSYFAHAVGGSDVLNGLDWFGQH